MPYLEVRFPQGKKRVKLEHEPLTIGRHANNALVLPDDRASRHHCVIEPLPDGFQIRDLGSSNGTKLNAAKVDTEMLDNGDVVRIGNVELHFIDPEQQGVHKRPNTPDFTTEQDEDDDNGFANLLSQPTLDVDLSEAVTDAQTGYERKLREIIDAALDKPFGEDDISLVDCTGVTVHQAASAGLDTGSEGEGGEAIRAFRLMLLACFRARATDLHIEPRIDNAAIRLRVDGYMLSAVEISMAIFKRILGVIKILCQIDTSQ